MVKKVIKGVIGTSNVRYLKSFFKSREEKEANRRMIDFYRQFLTKDDLFIDIGANFGNRIEPILSIGANVVAVEPQTQCYRFLAKKYGSRIQLVKKGLSAQEGVQELYVSNASTISSFSKDWIDSVRESGRFSNYNWNKKERVEMTTLDRVIEQYGLPKFVKIDVEGYELEVLNGLSKSVDYLSFEYTFPERTSQTIECIERIDQITNNARYNFSKSESMSFGNEEWLPGDKMIAFIRSEMPGKTGFGDIYAKSVD